MLRNRIFFFGGFVFFRTHRLLRPKNLNHSVGIFGNAAGLRQQIEQTSFAAQFDVTAASVLEKSLAFRGRKFQRVVK